MCSSDLHRHRDRRVDGAGRERVDARADDAAASALPSTPRHRYQREPGGDSLGHRDHPVCRSGSGVADGDGVCDAALPLNEVTRMRIRDAERAWQVYRDAYVEFAKLRWPSVSGDSWLTLLTNERMKQLRNLPLH